MIRPAYIQPGMHGYGVLLLRRMQAWVNAYARREKARVEDAEDIYMAAWHEFRRDVQAGKIQWLTEAHCDGMFARKLIQQGIKFWIKNTYPAVKQDDDNDKILKKAMRRKERLRLVSIDAEIPGIDDDGLPMTLKDLLPSEYPTGYDAFVEAENRHLVRVELPKYFGIDRQLWNDALDAGYKTLSQFLEAVNLPRRTYYRAMGDRKEIHEKLSQNFSIDDIMVSQ